MPVRAGGSRAPKEALGQGTAVGSGFSERLK